MTNTTTAYLDPGPSSSSAPTDAKVLSVVANGMCSRQIARELAVEKGTHFILFFNDSE